MISPVSAVTGTLECVGPVTVQCVQLLRILKGTVQRKLTGVESDINQKVFLSHNCRYFLCKFLGNLLFK